LNVTGWGWVIVVGGALQAIGVLVLVLEIVRSTRRREAYRTRPAVVEVGTIEARATVFTPRIVTDPLPPIEGRVERLEEGLTCLRNDLEELSTELGAAARAAADEVAGRATRHGDRRLEALERLVLGETTLDRWVRGGSIAAVVLGVMLSTIGSVAP
jgi:hypothetical protein